MPLSTLIILGAIVLAATVWHTVVAGVLANFIVSKFALTRKEIAMSNSSAILTAIGTAVASALAAKDTEIADLKAQVAATDPTVTADLAADETEIANLKASLTAAGVAIPDA